MLLRKDYHLFLPTNLKPDNYHAKWLKPLIDVRSEQEFQSGTIVGAQNIPLFNNQERSKVGFTYKNHNVQSAIDLGYQLAEKKLHLLKQAVLNIPFSVPVYVFCARGGFRSAAVCKLLVESGFNPVRLQGGYKAYRQWSLNFLTNLEFKAGIYVLHGKTGVGKTKFLSTLPNFLDLEKAANHRGSLLGHIGLEPNNQKNFESNLIAQIQKLDLGQPVFIEGESSKIGSVFIPKILWQHMRMAPKILAIADITHRIARIYQEYVRESTFSADEILAQLDALKWTLAPEKLNAISDLIKQGLIEQAIQRLCLEYYDPKYAYHHKQINFVLTINLNDFTKARSELFNFVADYKLLNDQKLVRKSPT